MLSVLVSKVLCCLQQVLLGQVLLQQQVLLGQVLVSLLGPVRISADMSNTIQNEQVLHVKNSIPIKVTSLLNKSWNSFGKPWEHHTKYTWKILNNLYFGSVSLAILAELGLAVVSLLADGCDPK